MKKDLIEQFHFLGTDEMPVHAGMGKDDLKGTVVEFFLMSKATSIFSLSVYEWGSTFSTMCSAIYDIPLMKLKI